MQTTAETQSTDILLEFKKIGANITIRSVRVPLHSITNLHVPNSQFLWEYWKMLWRTRASKYTKCARTLTQHEQQNMIFFLTSGELRKPYLFLKRLVIE